MFNKLLIIGARILSLGFFSYPLKALTLSKISRPLIPVFAKHYQINQGDMVADIKSYKSLSAFFAREINLEKRPIAANDWVSPVDGFVQEFGEIDKEQTFTVKGTKYRLNELLDDRTAGKFGNGGSFIIVYLSPSQYHRYHSPITGKVKKLAEFGKVSFPVNDWGLDNVDKLYVKNHRIAYQIGEETLLIAVGALNINSIVDSYEAGSEKQGQEVGYFTFGSTVVLLSPDKQLEWQQDLAPGKFIKVRSGIADYK
ncbi:phosphatidylserine decarboxylase [Brochothrix thermosphacta]|uniref:archaetidylserine decarboxylase n=1 Tax=Brochothrix thermosphacta TaxID=2756 RepID=UPI000E76F119|nr:archaetidylserine decarboxylase [Brochothrix thermosphacta]ANZ98376.1 phosphatidylserine decarboxylase [Brochothrix thermosphacta]